MKVKKIIKNILKKISKIFRYKVVKPVYIPVLSGNFLKDRNILITGGAGGIGRSIAEVCLKNGASVILTGRNEDKLIKVKKELSALISTNQIVDYVKLDVTNVSVFDEVLLDVEKKFENKQIYALVNCAGINAGGTIGNTSENQFDKTIETNLKGTYFLCQAFSNYLISKKLEGNILNVSSSSGNRPVISPYMYSKWGINGLTKGLAKKLISKGIIVNAIAPGPTATEMLELDGSNLYCASSPSERYADSIEIANLAVYLISDMGKMVVGETIYITGGCGTLTYDDIDYIS